MRSVVLFSILFFTTLPLLAQERKMLRKGNELYEQKKFPEAAAAYKEALKKQPQSVTGSFNLGNALDQQKQYEAARKTWSQAAKETKDAGVQSGAHYNTGNTFMSEQEWQKAVDAYKQALRKQPGDPDAQYNLSYALSKLKQQQNQNKDQNKDQKKDQQKQKDDKKDDKKDQQNQDQQEPKDQDKQDQKRQPQPSKLSEQQADNLLKALQQDERRTQDKMQQSKAMPVKLEKDW